MRICSFLGLLFAPLIAMARPSQVIDLSAVSTNGGAVITWTAPAPSGATTLTNLDVRWDTSPINTLNWNSKTRVSWLTDPGTPGTVQTAMITDLVPGATYYFAIKVQDSLGTWSTMSYPAMTTAGNSTYYIQLAWDTSPDPSVAGYNIYYGAASRTYTDMVSAGNATTVYVSNLVWGVTYFFTATDYNSTAEESDYSAEITYSQP